MKTIILDTNAFLRYFLNDIPQQKEEVLRLLTEAKSGKIKIYVPQIIVFEVQFILDKYYHIPKHKIIETLQPFISAFYIEIESRESFITALNVFKLESVSFVDCFLIAKAQQEEAELFTFDKQLKRLAEQ